MLRLPDSWVWDSWYVFDGEVHHAFYLRASRALGDPNRRHRYPFVGHAISKDLKNWTIVSDALAVSDSPAFDSWTTWTGSVVKGADGLWWMFYTGSSREDGGDVQTVGAATSEDLFTWSKVSDKPLVSSDSRWYETLDAGDWHDEAWRDPWVFNIDSTWHMLITARANTGEKFERGVVGHATSKDLLSWTVQPPLSEPNSGFGQTEVFQVEEIDGVVTLIFCCGTNELSSEYKAKFGQGGMFSVTADSKLGPFDLTQSQRFDHPSIYAARVVQHEGDWFLIGFRDHEDGRFVGELTDPIKVSSQPGIGLVRV